MKRFFDFVEIRTKITSVFVTLLALTILFMQRQPVRLFATSVFFVSMLSFDLTTTAINNYIDSRTGHALPYKRSVALAILLALLTFSIAGGLVLVFMTDVVVLLLGMACFACGILYTFGPLPISGTPFGEILSGFFYGFIIPFLMLYINSPPGSILSFSMQGQTLSLSINAKAMLNLVLISAIPTLTTADIMLANNICDVDRDVKVKRYTLAHYLGAKTLRLFAWLYYLCYADIAIMVLLRVLSPVCLAFFLTWKIVRNNIKVFFQKQEKATTFSASIRNYVVINGTLIILIFIGGLIG